MMPRAAGVSDDGKANTTAARSTEPLSGKKTTVLMEADQSFPDLQFSRSPQNGEGEGDTTSVGLVDEAW